MSETQSTAAESTVGAHPLIVLQQSPHSRSLALAALDLVMACAVFAQNPSVLITGDAVMALSPDQAGTKGQKSLRKVIDSMPLYDVEDVFVDELSLAASTLEARDLPDFVEVIDHAALARLRQAASRIVSL